uniref:Uncharacterized protein n=1 Tax=virus sp. ct1Uu26 TaxID=2826789 RepID=A0A8S5R8W7_9VIRU|nr:MAG TPA: hypothetical protein [virus sp. ct1Uu26]DAI03244.1 MAG TPA: hypothetical protein [Caudoviricetes sp.]DAQ88743.1 MAG TPA: hypothetical protein [Caudoviricetes sp.]DAS13395.1 MAG TPA: hypothetical protein [Caudoviricetes sp.]DAX26100.1 MAG TPA: hypothetical protein [Caudoviricetes sp.]
MLGILLIKPTTLTILVMLQLQFLELLQKG